MFKIMINNFEKDQISIKKGVIARGEIVLPYSRIQNVYVDQDVLDRIFALYDVHLETAGLFSGIHAHIDGVGAEYAAKLRSVLMAKSKQTLA